MTIVLTPKNLALYCEASVVNAAKYVDQLNLSMAEAGLFESKVRTAMFLAQIAHESTGLSRVEENLNYSAKRLTEVWPSRFPTLASAAPFANNPKALANKVYGGRMGNIGPNDGWDFRGRGLKQLTGRDNYTRYGYANRPDEVAQPHGAAITAVAFWSDIGGNVYADRGDFVQLTRAINGGTTGLPDRQRRFNHIIDKL